MNYRHIYHAGNFVDVIKHTVLTIIVEYLRKKQSPFCYIDTHAGAGIYDLTSVEAVKTGEAVAGAQRIINSDHPDSMQAYLRALEPYRVGDRLTHYPGSPLLVYHMLRPQDRMILNEYHPEINRLLKQNFHGKSPTAIHQRDAYEFLPAMLPPPVPRGLVLIDPPFEQKDEFEKIQTMLEKCLKRWAHGIYMIWYPVTTRQRWDLSQVVQYNSVSHYLIAELTIAPKNSVIQGLLGCQLLIINPPWQLANRLRPLLKHLWEIFSIDQRGSWVIVDE